MAAEEHGDIVVPHGKRGGPAGAVAVEDDGAVADFAQVVYLRLAIQMNGKSPGAERVHLDIAALAVDFQKRVLARCAPHAPAGEAVPWVDAFARFCQAESR